MDFPTAADLERREYDRLHERLDVEQDAEVFLHNARAVARFVNDEPNPVYGEALIISLLSRAHLVIQALQDEPPTYAAMMVRRVGTTTLSIFSLWRGIMDDNAPHEE